MPKTGCYETFLHNCSSGRLVALVTQIQLSRQLLEASQNVLEVLCDILRKCFAIAEIWTRGCSALKSDREGLGVLSLSGNSFDVLHSDKFLVVELNFNLFRVIKFTIRQKIQSRAESDTAVVS